MIPSDSIFEHAAVNEVIAVGAIDSQDPGNNDIEPFSSQGPVTIMYPNRETRIKPDICGIDNVRVTGAGGFSNPFRGTSASAPHVAGISALIWSANPSIPANEIRSALLSSATDLGVPGNDPVFGHGLANAATMLSIVYTPTPTPTLTTPTPTLTTPTPTLTTPTPTLTQTTQPTTTTITPTTISTTANPNEVPPMELWGQVTDGGAAAPEGSIILAKIGNDEKARISLVSAGRYGGSGAFDQRLKIVLTQAEIAAGYPEISFWMNGKEAREKVRFNPGSSQQLDLTFSPSLTSPTPTQSPTVTATITTTVTPTPTAGPAEITLDLHPGWNFISTPKTLKSGYDTAKVVFSQVNTQAHSIYRYDTPSQSWAALGADDQVRPLEGIWVYSAQHTQINLKFKNDPVQTPPTKPMYKGWNSIGFSDTTPASAKDSLSSISTIWSIVLGFDAEYQYYEPSIINGGSGSHSDLNSLSPGKGYWVFTNGPGTLAAIGV
nr:S8 family serine peptidase [Methanolinea mesophila]